MDLVRVDELVRPQGDQAFPPWQAGDAFVAGGTWLFSEAQPAVKRLIDLSQLSWIPFSLTAERLEIAANCNYAALENSDWEGLPGKNLFVAAIRSLSSSFKTYGVATVGGNVCLAYAKGMMAPTFVSLGATYELISRKGEARVVSAAEFQTGVCRTILQPGEYLRKVVVPRAALTRRYVLRRASFNTTSHAIAMVIATRGSVSDSFELTLSAALSYPVKIAVESADAAGSAIDEVCAVHPMVADAHGSAPYRKALLRWLAAEAIAEVSA